MDYTNLFLNTLGHLGFDVVAVWNTFGSNYHHHPDPEPGWPLTMPTVDWKPNTVLLLHFQDFVTHQDGRIIELDCVAKHYGEHANRIIVTHMHHGLEKLYDGPIHLIEFSNHNIREMERLQARVSEWQSAVGQPKTQGWQCLNGRECPHRQRAADVLQTWSNGVLSYGTVIPLDTWHYGTYRGTENDENFIRLLPIYGTCAVNIVTETQYDHWPGVICEKTLLAILAQQIPILISYPGAVADTRELGFDMFDDLVDHSYDNLPNDVRVEQAILRNRELILNPPDLAAYQERLKRNRDHALWNISTYYHDIFKRRAQEIAAVLLPV